MKDSTADKEYYLGVEEKLSRLKVAEPLDCICLWSDLLGFGTPFMKNNWELSPQDWIAIQKRLFKAQSIAISNYDLNQKILVLNDGIAVTNLILHKDRALYKTLKVYNTKGELIDEIACADSMLQLSMFIRSCVMIHQSINDEEKASHYPGTRSVIAFGQCAPYINPQFTKQDFRLRQVKEGKSPDIERESNADETIVFNPYSFQMNTAFSKAYIIESIGSKGGIEGSNLFIDESVISIIRHYASDLGYKIIEREGDDYVELLVPRNPELPTNVILGFRLSKPFKPGGIKFDTQVYQLKRFYPDDELTTEFWFDLENPE